MMSEKEFIESQKDCAKMLGMTLEEYEEFCKDTKIPKEILKTRNRKRKYDNSLLKYLGLTPKNLL